MPKGQYNRKTSKQRSTKSDIRQFAEFCLREEIATQLQSIAEPWMLAIKLFQQETGIEIRPQKAKNQLGKWIMINGEVYRCKTQDC